jgi:hypothetical protein
LSARNRDLKDHWELTERTIGAALGVAVNTTAIEQYYGIIFGIVRHADLDLGTKRACTEAVVADLGLVIDRGIAIVIVVQDGAGS